MGIYWVSWILSIQIPCRKRSHIPPGESRNIIDSKVPAGMGYVIVPWRVYLFVSCWKSAVYLGCGPFPVTVTTRIATFLVGNPYKPSFTTVTGKGATPKVYQQFHQSYHGHAQIGFPRRSIRQFPCRVVEYRLGSIESRRISTMIYCK